MAAHAGVLPDALKPTLGAAKLIALLDRAWDDEFLDGFLATERWGNDNVAFPGACYERYIEELYRQNRLIAGRFTVCGQPGPAAGAALPAARDRVHRGPYRPATERLANAGGAGGLRGKQLLVERGGHVGAVVSRKAAGRLWPALHTFWSQRD